MKADRYLPWHTVHVLKRCGAVNAHGMESSGRVPAAPPEVLEGGCLLYRLPRIAGHKARTTPARGSGNRGGGD